jgi:hypothetical protein
MVRLKVAFNQVGQATYLEVQCPLLVTYFILIAIEVAVKRFELFPLHKQIEKYSSMPDSPFPKSDSRVGNTSWELRRPGREPGHSHKSSTEF